MHTFCNNERTFTILYNGDHSGDIIIIDEYTQKKLRLPFDVIKQFFGEYIRQKRQETLDLMSTDKLFE